MEGAEILNRTGLPFIVQTTAGSHNLAELDAIADFAHDRLAAKVWNLYFLVPTGRGQFVSDITPAQDHEVLASLYRIQQEVQRPDARQREVRSALHQDRSGKHPPSRGVDVNALRRGKLEAVRARRSKPLQATPSPPTCLRSGPTPGGGRVPCGDALHGDTAEWGLTPCPYLPVFAGTLRSASLADLWTSSELFTEIRRRSSLGGRCGACEMNGHCGGCRARAFGMTGDLMAEDPLCTHTPGKFAGLSVAHVAPAARLRPSGLRRDAAADSVCGEAPPTIAWDDAAAARMKKIPAFVRGMVVAAVEEPAARTVSTA